MAKSVCVAYLLWLVGGWVGLHHFYLRRDRQAFVWWATCGGVFGMGFLRDFFRIPAYVAEANGDSDEDKVARKEILDQMSWGRPRFSITRFVGELTVGWLFGALSLVVLPEETMNKYQILVVLMPYAVAMGVHVVANIGKENTRIQTSIVGAYLVLPLALIQRTNVQSLISHAALASAGVTNWKSKGWKPLNRRRGHWLRRFIVLSLCCGLYTSMWGSAFYHNAYVTTGDGERVRVKDAIDNFFKSPAWAQSKETMSQMYKYYQIHGFNKMWEEFVKALDPEGEENAYKVLGVDASASEKEVTAAYKKLVRQWHPDTIKDQSKKAEAQEKFIEIQKAYETVSSIKARRSKRNEKDRRAKDERTANDF